MMLEDLQKQAYLTTRDFLFCGIPTSVACTVLVVTLGYGIMVAMGY